MGRNKSVRIRVRKKKDITDRFTSIPNALLRGEFDEIIGEDYSDLSELERIFLGCGLSCRDEWETSVEATNRWLPSCGRDRCEQVRRSLREKGFLSMSRDRVESGPDAGMIFWNVDFHLIRLPEDERDKLTPKTAKPRKRGEEQNPPKPSPEVDESPNTMPWNSGHGKDHQESPGNSMPWHAGHGGPGHGDAGPGGQGNHPYIEKEQERKNISLSREGDQALSQAPDSERENFSSSEKPLTLDGVVDKFCGWQAAKDLAAKYPSWRREVVKEVLQLAFDDGKGTYLSCAAALVRVVQTGRATSARLLLQPGPWWDAALAQSGGGRPPQSPQQGEPCGKTGHTSRSVNGCTQCAAEAKAAPEPGEPGPVDPQAAERAEKALEALKRNRASGVPSGRNLGVVAAQRSPSQMAAV